MFTRESKIILILAGLSHFAVHYSMVIFPVIRLVLKEEFGADLIVLGWIGGISGFMFGLGAIPAGWLEGKFGGRSLLLFCQLGMALTGVTLLFAQHIFQITTALFFLGLFASIYHPAGLTLISRRIRQISRAMGYHGIAGSLGLTLGWVLAAWFAANASWRMAYGAMSIFYLCLFLATFFLIPSKRRTPVDEEINPEGSTKVKPLLIYYSIAFLIGIAFYGLNYLPVHFNENSGNLLFGLDRVFRNGLLTTLVFLAGVGGQLLGGKIGDKYQRTASLPIILLANVPFLIAIGLTSDYWLVGFAVCVGVTHFAFQPVGNSLIAQYTNSSSRGLGYGVSFFLSFGAGSIAEPLGGYLSVNYGVENLFIIMAIILAAAFILALYLKRVS